MAGGVLASDEIQDFFNRLRVVMQHKGWNKSKLAKKIGLAASSISRWEHGIYPPTATTIDRICAGTGCDREWLLTGNGVPWEEDSADRTAHAFVEEREKYMIEIENELDKYLQKKGLEISNENRYMFMTFIDSQYSKGRKFTKQNIDIFFDYIGNIRNIIP